MRLLIYFIIFCIAHNILAQASFTASSGDGCLGTSISLDNTSLNAVRYEWDFCLGDFTIDSPIINQESVTGLSGGKGYALVEDGGIWYSFVLSGSNLLRVLHGSSPLNAAESVDNLGSFGLLSSAESIDIIEFGRVWYGVVGSLNGNAKLTRLNFPTGLSGTVTGQDLGTYGKPDRKRDVRLIEESGGLVLLFSGYNSNKLYRVDYGSSFDNVIDEVSDVYESTVSNLSLITGFDVQKIAGNYIVHALSLNGTNIIRLNFGSSLLNSPTVEGTYSLPGLESNSNYRLHLLEEGGSYYGFVGSESGTLQVYSFGDLSVSQTPVLQTYSSSLPSVVSYHPYRNDGVSYLQGVGGSSFHRLLFGADCGASVGSSTEFEPSGVSYSSSGTKGILLKAIDGDGDISYAKESVVINDNQAPSFSLSTDDNVCISNSKTFTATDASSVVDVVTSYSWDFDGDDVVDLLQNSGDAGFGTASVDYNSYGGSGSYTVKLTGANAGGCRNFETLTFTLYDEPATPTDLTTTAVSLCTNNAITFSYDQLAGLPSEASLIWDIDGEFASTDNTPVYTFTTSGDKEISLQVVLPTCTTAVYVKTVSIAEGPAVDFGYTNNCFGEAIAFTDASGLGTNYTWDFGDGSAPESNATSFNPSHTYAAAGTYTVSLTVANAEGCETSATKELEVTDQSLVDFTNGTSETNVPISFTGIDATLSDNAVSSWLWDFGGEGSSTAQTASYTFSTAGDYEVTLSVTTEQGCTDAITKTITVSEAEFPTASFTASSGDGCLGTSISLDNTSVNALSYEWDFCLGDFTIDSPIINQESVTGLSGGKGYALVEDGGIWYSFVLSGNNLLRVLHGSSPLNAAESVDNLGSFGLLSSAESIDIIEFGGVWYGVVGSLNSNTSLTRLDFPMGLGGEVTGVSLGTFGSGDRKRDVRLIEESGGLVLLFSGYNSNKLYRVDYGSSFDNVIDEVSDVYESTVSNLSLITGFDVQKIAGNYIVHALSLNGTNIIRLNFGSSLLNSPTVEGTYSLPGLESNSNYRLHLLEEGGSYYGFVGSESGALQVYSFGDLSVSQTPVLQTYSSSLPSVVSYHPYRNDGVSYLQGVGGSSFHRLLFGADCGASVGSSTEFEPSGVSYSSSGTKGILLKAIDGDGDISYAKESVVINDNQAPSFSLSTDDNVCISNSKTFTATDASSVVDVVTSYSWDFDGDDVVDLVQNSGDAGFGTASVDYNSYGGSGSYTVKLTGANAGGCRNFETLTFTLYDEPATPTDLTTTAVSLCTNNAITFSYDQLAGLPSEASLIWDIDGEFASTDNTPVYTFTTSGDKEISLQVVLPTCTTAVYVKTVSIAEGPAVDFGYTNNCFGEAIAFTDASGLAANYTWDFGDGSAPESNATSFNPSHTYAAAGTYTVSLTVANAEGCETSATKELEVTDQSLVDFTNGTSETNVPISFTGIDATLSDNAVSSWLWGFGGEGSFTGQSASYTFSTAGDYEVTLSVTTEQGCTDAITKTITVSEAEFPTASFTASSGDGCLGTSISLDNTSVNAVRYEWDFCLGDFTIDSPIINQESVTGLSGGKGYALVEDGGIWYSFVLSGNNLLRVLHGSSPLNAAESVDNLGSFGLLSSAESIDIIEFGGVWYGVVGSLNNNASLVRLDFPTGLSGTVTGQDLGTYGKPDRKRDVGFIEESGGLVLLFSGYNTNKLYRVDYGSSFDNVIDEVSDVYESTVSNLSLITGFDVQKIAGNYIVHALSLNATNIIRLNFGSSLLNSPTVEGTYSLPGLESNSNYRLHLLEEGGSYYGFVGSESGALQVYSFGDLSVSQTPVFQTYSSSLPSVVSYHPYRYDGVSYLQGVGGSSFHRLVFRADCGASVGSSTVFEPSGVSYSSSGTKEILLKAIDGDGDVSYAKESVVINDNQAPSFSLSTDDNVCISNSKTFTATDASSVVDVVTSYSWDFDGDDVVDLVQNSGDAGFGTASVDYNSYGGSGSYTVKLTGVNAGGCRNFETLTFTLYDEPATPTDLTTTAVSLCTNNAITFSYDQLAGLPSEASLIWDIDGEFASTDNTPVYTFTTSGDKEISLQVVLPTCTTAVYVKTVSIAEGPAVDFGYTNNCFGEAIAFTDASGLAANYTWDFGDGSAPESNATSFNPSHTYAAAGTYTVSLTVANAEGCETSATKELEVTDQSLVDFTNGTSETNVPISFAGIDATLSDNAVSSWLWGFGGEGSFTGQSASYTFSTAGDYEVTLSVTTEQGCTDAITKTITVSEAEFPTASFTASSGDGCLGTSISLDNTSVNAVRYEWDFCLGDFTIDSPIINQESVTGLSGGKGYALVEDGGIWYSFVLSGNNLLRVLHGSSPLNAAESVDNLGSFGLLSSAESIDIIEFGGVWYGVVGSLNNNASLVRLDFPTGLSGTVTGQDLGTYGKPDRKRDVGFIEESGGLVLLFSGYNTNKLYRVDYGSSFDNVIDEVSDVYESTVSNLSLITGFDVQKIAGNYIVHALSLNATNIIRLNFGSSLLNSPTVEGTYSLPGLESNSNYRLHLLEEGGSYYGFVGSESGALQVYSFGDLSVSQTPVLQTYSSSLPSVVSYHPYRYDGVSYLQGVGGSSFHRLVFRADCGASVGSSTVFEPSGVSYSSSGTKEILLKAIDGDGDVSYAKESVVINDNQAPSFSLSTDDNVCISNSKTFTATDASSVVDVVTSYSWDFDGDDVVDLVQNSGDAGFGTASVDYNSYGGSGSYTVKLTGANAGGCRNFETLTFTLYDEPATPTDLTTTAVSLCTNNAITFSYDQLAGLPSEASLIWDIDGEFASTDNTPVYTFTTSGDKEISLQVVLPTCTTAVYVKTVSIAEGPAVDFGYTNNCFGEAIAFTDASGLAANYTWDFGDGSAPESNATSFNPSHTYAAAGTYTVSLTVANAEGCETSATKELEVTDQSLVDFTNGTSETNVPISFAGIDATLSDNAVSSWLWGFGGEGSFTGQSASYTFSTAGDYEVTLSVTTEQGCTDAITKTITVSEAEFPTASFTASSGDGCLGTSISLDNTSVNAVRYEWDFCLGDFTIDSPIINQESVTGLSGGKGYALVEDGGIWYSFVLSGNNLLRVLHGSSPLNAAESVDNLGSFGLLSSAESIDIIEFGGVWYGVVGSLNNNASLVRLDFPTGLSGTVTGQDLGTYGKPDRKRDVGFIEESGGLVLLFSGYNTNKLYRVDYGSSFDNVIDEVSDVYESTVSNLSLITGFDVQKIAGNYIVHALSLNATNIIRLNFGSSLLNSPTVEGTYSLPGLESNSNYRLHLLEEGGSYYGFVGSESGALQVYSFGDLSVSQTPVFQTYSSSLPSVVSYHPYRYDGVSYLQGVGGSSFHRLVFRADCGASVGSSTVFEPSGVSYSSSGTKEILLKAIDGDGDVSYAKESVVINDNQAPSFSLSTDDNVCVAVDNSFSVANISGDISSYSWDFGDGNTSTEPSPSYQYATPGTYTIRLDVSDGSCGNFAEQEVTVYPEPPIPTTIFASSDLCVGSEVTIQNQTDTTGYGRVISYAYSFTGQTDTTTNNHELAYVFDSPGEKILEVRSLIPGCESEIYRDTILIIASPILGFSANSVCEGDLTIFTNDAEGLEFLWNFGDGFTSNEKSPTHLYASNGTFNVELQSTNVSGCTSTENIEVIVSALPEADFDYELVCEADNVLLTDVSIVDGSDIVAWEWYLSDELVSESESPEVVFSDSGNQIVTLIVTASNGCSSTITQDLAILSKPPVDFEVQIGCAGSGSIISDLFPNNDILSRSWFINGQSLDSNEAQLTYDFPEAGEYNVELSIINQNFCAATKSKTINVLSPPSVSFQTTHACEGEDLRVLDNSISVEDPILSRKWFLNNELVGNGAQIFLSDLTFGTKLLRLEVTTAQGCNFSTSQSVEIFESPKADFEVSADFGVPPFNLQLNNQSDNAISYDWYLNDTLFSSLQNPELVISEEGNFSLKLVSQSEEGCKDSSIVMINSAMPKMDLSITNLALQEESVLLELTNSGNLPVASVNYVISLADDFSFAQRYAQRVNIGEKVLLKIDINFPKSPDFICVNVQSPYGTEDLNPDDNEVCINIKRQAVLEAPFPNPAKDFSRIRFVIPETSLLKLSLVDLSGQVKYYEEKPDPVAGLNVFNIDLFAIVPGTYFFIIEYQGASYQSRIIKQ